MVRILWCSREDRAMAKAEMKRAHAVLHASDLLRALQVTCHDGDMPLRPRRLRNLVGRIVKYVEDRTEGFDDYILCKGRSVIRGMPRCF